MMNHRKHRIGIATQTLLIGTAAIAFSWIAMPASAQSIHIQSWNSNYGFPFGGMGIGGPMFAPVLPHSHYGHHHHGHSGFGHSGFGHSGFGYPGLSYGFGNPYQSFNFSLGSPYGYAPFPYQSDYIDYRSEYNRRLYDSYQPYSPFNDRSYRPPVAEIEPFYGAEIPGDFPYDDSLQSTPSRNLPEALRAAANRLSMSLSRRRDDGDVWLDYLAPGRIISTIDQGLPVESISELMKNFDGVVGNPELRMIAVADGFESTRQLLRQWIETTPAAEAEATPEVPPIDEVAPAPEDVPAEAALVPNRRSV